MIELKIIPCSLSGLKDLIRYSYESDAELIEKYQAGERSLEECVDFNYGEIEYYYNNKVYQGDISLWKIALRSGKEINPIGYCVTIKNDGMPNVLMSFAININYRKSVFLTSWLTALENIVGESYYTVLWNKNTRAIDFFKKNGFVEKPCVREPRCTYLIKGENLIRQNQRVWQ